MVAFVKASKEEQADLCDRAKAGDREAADRLALAVWGWCRRKAGEYARRFRVDADDLESVGLSRLPYVIRGYSRDGGASFLNYFASAAAREMLSAAKKEVSRPEFQCEAAGDLEPASERGDYSPGLVALAGLDPLAREVVRLVCGIDGRAVEFSQAALLLGISEDRCKRVYLLAVKHLREIHF